MGDIPSAAKQVHAAFELTKGVWPPMEYINELAPFVKALEWLRLREIVIRVHPSDESEKEA